MAAALSDAHRRFLQALLARGVVEAAEAERLRRLCCQRHPAPGGSEQLDDFVGALNEQLQPLSMEIRKGSAEDSGRTYVALVNLAETNITKMASDFSESELELFKKTLDLILLSGNGFASSTEILNLADQLKPKKMKKMEVEQVLQQLVQKKWLCEKEGEYTLHVRSILELEQYIFRHYPESARKCHICHSLSVQSQVCEDCGIVLHCSCLSKYFQTQPEPRCPHCKQFWPHRIPDLHSPSQLPSSARRESRKASRMGLRHQQ
ncbi:PREDICTED: non-structural maintenance of chromosomes element 1 homolog isoform X2 [Thamnophis sirtalis]|uniref:Non-structural maintenance of chromosomes element 1 homolog n=1 Tax=Thamnophis sirtalis TaxID=35019 RepID=A0A6I9Y9N7_9SAUR|nr:PREDICTED: non-structural maintenance of chromosomes element 1 homolog isoform X2 [Thamnophis sirtalis]XP_032086535.1 non-structural maintenance of chromosomes element 1 homolog isoform X1 [Thamnophis elegans]